MKYGDGGLSASEDDLEGWALFNPEIDKFVRNGEIWMHPQTGIQLTTCPWLRIQPNQSESDAVRYSCDIYLDRPEDCRHYPTSLAEMLTDECEMIEVKDLSSPKRAQQLLDRMMSDSRPPLAGV